MQAPALYKPRNVASAAMLLFAVLIGVGAYTLVSLNQYNKLPDDWPFTLSMWVGLAVVSWTVVRIKLPYADPVLLPSVFLLNGLGISMIYRLDQATNPPMQSGRLQLMWTAASVVALLLVVLFLGDHRRLQRYTYVWFALGLVIVLLPLVPGLGSESFGARIWIKIGQFSFQPSEIAKIILSIAFAAYLTEKRDVLALAGRRVLGVDLPRMRDLGPIALMWLVSLAVLVFQKDLGTTLMFFSLFVVMVYIATQKRSWVILGGLMLVVMGVFGYLLFDHVQTRFSSWLTPFSDYERNFQVINAQFGFAYGGMFGTGWGEGRPYLTPLAKNDFIFAALGEELGLVGMFAILLVYLVFVSRILRAALATREAFGKLLLAGLGFVFGFQVFIIVGGVTRLMPLTGITTPFLSQGGSSLISNFLLLGLLLTVTHHVRKPQTSVVEAHPAPRPAPAGNEDLTQVVDLRLGGGR